MWKTAILVILLVMAAGCAEKAPDNTNAGPYSITVTDDLGKNITIVGIPERIVSTAPSNTEILYALGLGDSIVGVTEYCDYPSEATEKEKIGGFSKVNVEKVVALNPDLVVASTFTGIENIKKLEELGIPVIILRPKNIDDILDNIELIGKMTGKISEAANLVTSMRARIRDVELKAPKEGPKVLYLVWHDPPMSGGRETFIHDMIETAGGVNIAVFEGWKVMNLETILDENPDIIIVPLGHGSNQNKTYDFVTGEQSLNVINAVKNNRVYTIDGNIVSRSGPRIIDGLEKFAGWIGDEDSD